MWKILSSLSERVTKVSFWPTHTGQYCLVIYELISYWLSIHKYSDPIKINKKPIHLSNFEILNWPQTDMKTSILDFDATRTDRHPGLMVDLGVGGPLASGAAPRRGFLS